MHRIRRHEVPAKIARCVTPGNGLRITKHLRAVVEFVGHKAVRFQEIPEHTVRVRGHLREIENWNGLLPDNFSLNSWLGAGLGRQLIRARDGNDRYLLGVAATNFRDEDETRKILRDRDLHLRIGGCRDGTSASQCDVIFEGLADILEVRRRCRGDVLDVERKRVRRTQRDGNFLRQGVHGLTPRVGKLAGRLREGRGCGAGE